MSVCEWEWCKRDCVWEWMSVWKSMSAWAYVRVNKCVSVHVSEGECVSDCVLVFVYMWVSDCMNQSINERSEWVNNLAYSYNFSYCALITTVPHQEHILCYWGTGFDKNGQSL